ncbi:MAG: hypothetical protein H6646_05120 [Anaerolineales bacterium]|nr:hypothetical protein [Anaerolineales bacterium]
MKSVQFLLGVLLIAVSVVGPSGPVSAQADAPTGVTLDYFIATADYPNHILLEWETVSELNTQAFRIKRGTTPNLAAAAVVVPYVVAHPGSSLGYYYSEEDSTGLVDGTTYYYWIEDEELGHPGVWIAHPEYNPVVVWGFVCSVYDFDCNAVVNALDIAAAAQRWNCSLGDPCYDSRYDLNSDDRIDVIDIERDAAHWGCQYGDVCYG